MRWLACLMLCGVVGCGTWEGATIANPKLRISRSANGFAVESNRDDSVSTEGLIWDGETKKFELKKTEFIGAASPVRQANAMQIESMAVLATANWAGFAQSIDAVGGVLSEVMPYVPQAIAARALGKMPRSKTVTTPFGELSTGAGFRDDQINGLLSIAGTGGDANLVRALQAQVQQLVDANAALQAQLATRPSQ